MAKGFQAHCFCGRVMFEAQGAPIAAIACYCDDCQAVATQIDALPGGHSGIGADGGTVNTMCRKDQVRCVRGAELLQEHKLRPGSATTRLIATCCNSNILTRFDNWLPISALRTHSVNVDEVEPEFCIHTKYAPDVTKIRHRAPRHTGLPPALQLRVVRSLVSLTKSRILGG